MANRNQNIGTPKGFFKSVESYFGIKFEYDMAADAGNSLCANFYTEENDSLSQDWPTDGWLWLNPPFRYLTKWINKCYQQSLRGCKIVSIWPLSGDKNQVTTWRHSSVYVVHGRIWPENRGIMLCKWDVTCRPKINGLFWDGEILTKAWEQ